MTAVPSTWIASEPVRTELPTMTVWDVRSNQLLDVGEARRGSESQAGAFDGADLYQQIGPGQIEAQSFGKTLARLRSYREWTDNWDGEGTAAPSALSVDKAITLFSLLTSFPQNFSVSLDGDARPTFSVRDSIYEGYISVEANGSISFSLINGDEIYDGYELEFDDRALPDPLIAALEEEFLRSLPVAA